MAVQKTEPLQKREDGTVLVPLNGKQEICDPFLSQISGAPQGATFPVPGTIYLGVGELNQEMEGQRKQEGE